MVSSIDLACVASDSENDPATRAALRRRRAPSRSSASILAFASASGVPEIGVNGLALATLAGCVAGLMAGADFLSVPAGALADSALGALVTMAPFSGFEVSFEADGDPADEVS